MENKDKGNSREELVEALTEAVIKALNRGSVEGKYIDVGRIPFICDDIRAIKKNIDWLMKLMWMAIGGVGVLAIVFVPILVALIQGGKL